MQIDERSDALGACPSPSLNRCSDKGFLNVSTLEYLFNVIGLDGALHSAKQAWCDTDGRVFHLGSLATVGRDVVWLC